MVSGGEMDEIKPTNNTEGIADDTTGGVESEIDVKNDASESFGFPKTYDEITPETYETPDGRPTTLEKVHESDMSQKVVSQKSSRSAKWALWGAVALIIAGLSTATYWFWNDAEARKAEALDLKNQLASSQTTLKKLQDKINVTASKSTEKKSEAQQVIPRSDEQIIKDEVSAHIKAMTIYSRDYAGTTPNLTINSLQPNQASIRWMNGPTAGGGKHLNFFLKKSGIDWVVFATSYEGISGEVGEAYGFNPNL